MKKRSPLFAAVLGMVLPLIAGSCMHGISEPFRMQAKKENLAFGTVLKNPDAYTGRIVLWGGKIIETRTISEGTEMIVLQTAIDFMGRPREKTSSQGFFIARTPDILSPAVYLPGGEIVLAGEVIGARAVTPDAPLQKYPAVMIRELYLWDDYYSQDSSWFYWLDGH